MFLESPRVPGVLPGAVLSHCLWSSGSSYGLTAFELQIQVMGG